VNIFERRSRKTGLNKIDNVINLKPVFLEWHLFPSYNLLQLSITPSSAPLMPNKFRHVAPKLIVKKEK